MRFVETQSLGREFAIERQPWRAVAGRTPERVLVDAPVYRAQPFNRIREALFKAPAPKRNPDVLELLRASSATSQACLDETLMITAKLPSGYHRDLQRLKSPVFRSIDLAIDSVDIMAYLLEGLAFVPDNIKLDEGIFATEEAYRLVTEEGMPFRDAYREVAKRYAK